MITCPTSHASRTTSEASRERSLRDTGRSFYARSGRRLSTLALVDLVSNGSQLVDGEATFCRDATAEPFLVLASIRGDSWDVLSTEPDLIATVRRRFPSAADLF